MNILDLACQCCAIAAQEAETTRQREAADIMLKGTQILVDIEESIPQGAFVVINKKSGRAMNCRLGGTPVGVALRHGISGDRIPIALRGSWT